MNPVRSFAFLSATGLKGEKSGQQKVVLGLVSENRLSVESWGVSVLLRNGEFLFC